MEPFSQEELLLPSHKKLVIDHIPGKMSPLIYLVSESHQNSYKQVLFDPHSRSVTIGSLRVSPDGAYLALSAQKIGERQYQLIVIPTSEINGLKVINVGVTGFEWSNDSSRLYYVSEDRSLRPSVVHQYVFDTGCSHKLFTATDPTATLLLRPTKGAPGIFVVESALLGDSFRHVGPNGTVLSKVESAKGRAVFVDSLAGAPLIGVDDVNGSRLIYREKDVYRPASGYSITEVASRGRFVILKEKKGAQSRLVWFEPNTRQPVVRAVDLALNDCELLKNQPERENELNFSITGLNHPTSNLSLDLETGSIVRSPDPKVDSLTKRRLELISIERRSFQSNSKEVVDVVYARSSGSHSKPLRGLVLKSYGAYRIPPRQRSLEVELDLLDDEIGVGVAHLKGGDEYGSSNRLRSLKRGKASSINDLISIAEGLIAQKVVEAGKIVLESESAGAALATTAFLKRPGLFAGLIISAPVLDLEGLLRDRNLPGIEREVIEWGDPLIDEELQIIRSASPMNFITKFRYPPVLLSFATNDLIVPPWSIASWVQAYACTSRSENVLFLLPFVGHGHERSLSVAERLEYEAKRLRFIRGVLGGIS